MAFCPDTSREGTETIIGTGAASQSSTFISQMRELAQDELSQS